MVQAKYPSGMEYQVRNVTVCGSIGLDMHNDSVPA